MSLLAPVFDGFIRKIHNQDDSLLQDSMAQYSYLTGQFNKDFHKTLITDPTICDYIPQILDCLEITKPQSLRFQHASITVKEFFEELETLKPDDPSVQFIRSLLRKQVNVYRKTLLYGGIVGVLGISLPIGLVSQVLPLMSLVLVTVAYIPVISLIYTAGVAAYSFYQFEMDKKTTFGRRLYENVLFLASRFLQVLAYSFLIAGILTGSPVIGIFFCLAEFLILQKEVMALYRLHQAQKKQLQNPDLTPHEQARMKLDFQNEKNKVLINLAVAVAFVAIVGVMCFLTGGLIVPVASIVAIGVILLTRRTALEYNKIHMKHQLNEEFLNIESSMSEDMEHSPIHSSLPQLVDETDFDSRYEDEPCIENQPLIKRPKATRFKPNINGRPQGVRLGNVNLTLFGTSEEPRHSSPTQAPSEITHQDIKSGF